MKRCFGSAFGCCATLVAVASFSVAAEPVPVKGAAVIKTVNLAYEFEAGDKRIRVDRRPQQLRIDAEKPEAWLHERVEAGGTAEVTASTPLRKGTTTLARLAKGRKLYITAVEGQWAGTNVLIDGQPQAGWVLLADLQPLPGEPRAFRYLQNAGGRFVSAAMLVQKAKQFDDGLYAAVELAAADGLGKLPAKPELLADWAAAVDPPQGTGLTTLLAAGKLGGVDPAVPASQQAAVKELIAEFLADAERSKPLGFYTWSPRLENIYQQDRLLQNAIKGVAEVEPLAAALKSDKNLADAYAAHLRLFYRLTNPPIGGDSSDLLPLLTKGAEPPEGIRFWHIAPPSLSHETQLFLRLFAGSDVPDAFRLMPLLIDEIRSGRIDLRPRENSGWYDHQTWALEPLLLPHKMPEASHLACSDEYRRHLEELFKGTLALTRETHVKQLAVPAAAPGPLERDPKPTLVIQPQLDVEPLATFYLRRAKAYAFVRGVLVETFGEEALAKMRRQTAEGPVEAALEAELSQLETLFRGAHVVATRQLGREEDKGLVGTAAESDRDAAAFLSWTAAIGSDPDLARDARMMVPVHTNIARTRIKVWCLLGWEPRRAWVSFAKRPQVSGTDAGGERVDLADHFEIVYGTQLLDLATPIFAEVWVTKLLNRDEFRRHCDTYVTPSVILANLE